MPEFRGITQSKQAEAADELLQSRTAGKAFVLFLFIETNYIAKYPEPQQNESAAIRKTLSRKLAYEKNINLNITSRPEYG